MCDFVEPVDNNIKDRSQTKSSSATQNSLFSMNSGAYKWEYDIQDDSNFDDDVDDIGSENKELKN